jgi:glycosyltransferase involved in cell wall biosynthesis
MATPVAFYAPMKNPEDPTPSGDRELARLFLSALEAAGYAPECSSFLCTRHHGDVALPTLEAAATAEVDRLVAAYAARRPADRPRLWFTYHVYYKAPDLIGPAVARALSIPYVIAEGSRAPKRAKGPTARGHALAEAALDAAALILVPNPADWPMLDALRPPGQRLAAFPPFVDAGAWPEAARAEPSGRLRLLTVAMMRNGDKLASYELLAEALAAAALSDWSLDIVGSGPAGDTVRALFSGFGDRVRWHGAVSDRAVLGRLYAEADLLVWPAVNEALGMVFLEAARYGCPALAGAAGGVAGIVRDGAAGVLTPPGESSALARALAALDADRSGLARLGLAARQILFAEHTLEIAARRLPPLLEETMAGRGGAVS